MPTNRLGLKSSTIREVTTKEDLPPNDGKGCAGGESMTKKITITEEIFQTFEAEANRQNQTVSEYIESLARRLK